MRHVHEHLFMRHCKWTGLVLYEYFAQIQCWTANTVREQLRVEKSWKELKRVDRRNEHTQCSPSSMIKSGTVMQNEIMIINVNAWMKTWMKLRRSSNNCFRQSHAK